MTDASKILDKILPEKNEICYHQTINQKQLCLVCQAENELIDEIRQEMVDTYGKEWVVVPSEEKIKDILIGIVQIINSGRIQRGANLLLVFKEDYPVIAESILKGLRGK